MKKYKKYINIRDDRQTIGRLIEKFEDSLDESVERFNSIFGSKFEGNIVEIGEPIANDGRIIYIDGEERRFFLDKYESDFQIQKRLQRENRLFNNVQSWNFSKLNKSLTRLNQKNANYSFQYEF